MKTCKLHKYLKKYMPLKIRYQKKTDTLFITPIGVSQNFVFDRIFNYMSLDSSQPINYQKIIIR